MILLALIQAHLDRHRIVVMFGETGPRVYERCEAEGLYRYEPERLLEFLDGSDPTIRRNAACELADMGRREGIDLLTVEPNEPWTRRFRIASALSELDRERGAALMRPLLDDPHALARAAALERIPEAAERLRGDPSETVRRTAAKILGLARPDPAPEPRLTEAETAALRSLASEDAAVRDAASATLAAAPESAIPLLEAERSTDAEVRLRIARAIREIRNRSQAPVTLIRKDGAFILTNNADRPLTVQVHPDAAIATIFWELQSAGRWLVCVPGDCELSHEPRVLAPDASYEFRVPESAGTCRIEFSVQQADQRIKVVSEPFSD